MKRNENLLLSMDFNVIVCTWVSEMKIELPPENDERLSVFRIDTFLFNRF